MDYIDREHKTPSLSMDIFGVVPPPSCPTTYFIGGILIMSQNSLYYITF